MLLASWSDRVIRFGYYLLFALVPLLLTPWNYELFEFNKMMAVYALTVVITGAWLVKSIAQKELHIAKTLLDIPIALFVASQLVSALFSIDPHVSWFGYYSRFNGGMLSIFSYVLLYYAFVSNLANWTNWTNLLKGALATGGVVALYGVAERLGVDKHLWVQDVQNRVFSTLGQPNWLAAYLVALMPLGMAFALKSQIPSTKSQTNPKFQAPINKQNVLNSENWNLKIIWNLEFGIWCLFLILFFLVLLFTRSRSGLVGFAVADAVFWILIFIRSHRFVLPFFLLHFFFFLTIFLHGTSIDSVDRWVTYKAFQQTRSVTAQATPSGTLLETGGTESGTIRRYVWQGAINAWQSSLKTYLVGTGTETFAFAFYQSRPREHNLTSEWDFLYNKAHNEYLNYLATTGALGLGTYLLLICVFIYFFFKNHGFSLIFLQSVPVFKPTAVLLYKGNAPDQSVIINFALFAGWISILVTNFFGFSVVIVQLFLFLFPAIALASDKHRRISLQLPRWTASIVVLFTVIFVVFVAIGWYADTLYAAGYRASRAGQYDVAADRLSGALTYNPFEPLYADELGSVYAGLVTSAVEEKDATKAANFVKRSLSSSDRAITTSPQNVNFWKTRTKIYYSFSDFDPAFNDASIEALERAGALSLNDPKITYNLAILYGRKGANDKAIDLLKATINLKPNYRDAYYALWVFYTEIKKSDLARTVIADYLSKVDPKDKDFLERLNP